MLFVSCKPSVSVDRNEESHLLNFSMTVAFHEKWIHFPQTFFAMRHCIYANAFEIILFHINNSLFYVMMIFFSEPKKVTVILVFRFVLSYLLNIWSNGSITHYVHFYTHIWRQKICFFVVKHVTFKRNLLSY